MVGGHLINSQKEDGADIPSGGWLYEDDDGGFQEDVTLSVTDKLPVYPNTLPERIVVRSSGPAGDSHPTAMGLYNKLPGLPPVWEHVDFRDHKLFFDGENKNRNQFISPSHQAGNGS